MSALNFTFTSTLSLESPFAGTDPETHGKNQALAFLSFVAALSDAGYTVGSVTTAPPVFKPASVAQNGKGRFESAFLEWKGQQRMHNKSETGESREEFARRMLIEGGQSSLVESLDNMPDAPVGAAPTETEAPAYDPTMPDVDPEDISALG